MVFHNGRVETWKIDLIADHSSLPNEAIHHRNAYKNSEKNGTSSEHHMRLRII